MGKKNKNRQKKESPWKDIPVTTYEELHPKLNRTKEEKAALQKRKKDVNDKLALQRMQHSGPVYKPSATRKQKKKPKNVQIVPIQKLVEVGVDKDTGEKVFAKVKTRFNRIITHGSNYGNGTKAKGDTGKLVSNTVPRDILAVREADRPDPGPVPQDPGTETAPSVQSVPANSAQ